LTGDPDVTREVYRLRPEGTEVVGGKTARFIAEFAGNRNPAESFRDQYQLTLCELEARAEGEFIIGNNPKMPVAETCLMFKFLDVVDGQRPSDVRERRFSGRCLMQDLHWEYLNKQGTPGEGASLSLTAAFADGLLELDRRQHARSLSTYGIKG
jgi:hypothetical protein